MISVITLNSNGNFSNSNISLDGLLRPEELDESIAEVGFDQE